MCLLGISCALYKILPGFYFVYNFTKFIVKSPIHNKSTFFYICNISDWFRPYSYHLRKYIEKTYYVMSSNDNCYSCHMTQQQSIKHTGPLLNTDTLFGWRAFIIVILMATATTPINSSSPGQNGHHFTDDIFRCIFMYEKFCIWNKISLKYVPKGPINNITIGSDSG